MINSLFSSFDPIGSILSSNYLILIIVLTFPARFSVFKHNTRNNQFFNINLMRTIESELRATLSNQNKKGKINILTGIFIFVLLINVTGLFPYVFTLRAQIIFTLSIALPLWIRFIMFSFKNNTNHFLRHLVPLRTPLPLSQFIVLIETVRQIIRPITLSVRLAANITAGHILIALCRNTITIISRLSFVLMILILLEAAVAFIQSYVFTVLTTIYLREAYDKPTPPIPYSIPKTMTNFNRTISFFNANWKSPMNENKNKHTNNIKNTSNYYMLLSMMARCIPREIFSRVPLKSCYKRTSMRYNSVYYFRSIIFFFFFLSFFS